MRINAFVAQATGIGRRKADKLIQSGRVSIGNKIAVNGDKVNQSDQVFIDGKTVNLKLNYTTIALNKPTGYVVSRNGQGAKTIYELLPRNYHHLKPIGRLDKDSSGLLILTDNGQLAYRLSHPSNNKLKIYSITLNKRLLDRHLRQIKIGVKLNDGLSYLGINELSPDRKKMVINLSEGRNRQIRRTFAHLGYNVIALHRIAFGEYQLNDLGSGKYKVLNVPLEEK